MRERERVCVCECVCVCVCVCVRVRASVRVYVRAYVRASMHVRVCVIHASVHVYYSGGGLTNFKCSCLGVITPSSMPQFPHPGPVMQSGSRGPA